MCLGNSPGRRGCGRDDFAAGLAVTTGAAEASAAAMKDMGEDTGGAPKAPPEKGIAVPANGGALGADGA